MIETRLSEDVLDYNPGMRWTGVPLIPVWGPLVSKAEELGSSFVVSLLAGVVEHFASRGTEGRVD